MKGENKVKSENVTTYEKPSNTQTMDEKRAAVSHIELGILATESSKNPSESEINDRECLRDMMMFLGFVYNIAFYLSLLDKYYVSAGWHLVRSIVHFIGFTALFKEKRMLLKAFLVLYTLYFMVNTVLNGFEVRDMWSPSFCREMASSVKGFNFQQCQNNIGFDRVIKIIVMMGMFLFEASYLHTLQKIIEHDEMIENPKKQTNFKTTSTILT